MKAAWIDLCLYKFKIDLQSILNLIFIILHLQKRIKMNVSILNLLPIKQGGDAKEAIDAAIRLAKFAEDIGINRYWVAEHHNMQNLS